MAKRIIPSGISRSLSLLEVKAEISKAEIRYYSLINDAGEIVKYDCNTTINKMITECKAHCKPSIAKFNAWADNAFFTIFPEQDSVIITKYDL